VRVKSVGYSVDMSEFRVLGCKVWGLRDRSPVYSSKYDFETVALKWESYVTPPSDRNSQCRPDTLNFCTEKA